MSDSINDFITTVEANRKAVATVDAMSVEHKAYLELVRSRIERIEAILAADNGHRAAQMAGYQALTSVLMGLLCGRLGYEVSDDMVYGLQDATEKAVANFFAAREAKRIAAAKAAIDRIAGDASKRDVWNKLAKALDA